MQCNSVFQFLDRAVPEMDIDEALAGDDSAAVEVGSTSEIPCGLRVPSPLQSFVLRAHKFGMKAAFVC